MEEIDEFMYEDLDMHMRETEDGEEREMFSMREDRPYPLTPLGPKSEGGSDHKSNLADLCPNDHALAHELIEEGVYYKWVTKAPGGRTLISYRKDT